MRVFGTVLCCLLAVQVYASGGAGPRWIIRGQGATSVYVTVGGGHQRVVMGCMLAGGVCLTLCVCVFVLAVHIFPSFIVLLTICRDPVLQGFAFSFQNVNFNATTSYDYTNGVIGVTDLLSGVLGTSGVKNPYSYAGTRVDMLER